MAFKRFHIHLEEELKEKFDEYAEELGLSLSALFRLALIEKMKKDGKSIVTGKQIGRAHV